MELTRENIITWAIQKKLNNPKKQLIKFIEEVGELAGVILKGKVEDIEMELGDCLVVLTILAWQKNLPWVEPSLDLTIKSVLDEMAELASTGVFALHFDDAIKNTLAPLLSLYRIAVSYDLDPKVCMQKAYEKIKDREGVTVGGTFIKEEE